MFESSLFRILDDFNGAAFGCVDDVAGEFGVVHAFFDVGDVVQKEYIGGGGFAEAAGGAAFFHPYFIDCHCIVVLLVKNNNVVTPQIYIECNQTIPKNSELRTFSLVASPKRHLKCLQCNAFICFEILAEKDELVRGFWLQSDVQDNGLVGVGVINGVDLGVGRFA